MYLNSFILSYLWDSNIWPHLDRTNNNINDVMACPISETSLKLEHQIKCVDCRSIHSPTFGGTTYIVGNDEEAH